MWPESPQLCASGNVWGSKGFCCLPDSTAWQMFQSRLGLFSLHWAWKKKWHLSHSLLANKNKKMSDCWVIRKLLKAKLYQLAAWGCSNSLFLLDVEAIAVILRAPLEFVHGKNSPLDAVFTHAFVSAFLWVEWQCWARELKSFSVHEALIICDLTPHDFGE